MSVLASPAGVLPERGRTRLALVAAALLACSTVIAVGLYKYPPPSLPLAVIGGLGALGILMLAVSRYDVAVGLGFVIFGVVFVEPSPPDVILGCVIVVGLLTGRVSFARLPLVIVGSVGLLLALSLFTIVEAVDLPRALFFFSITLYVCVFSLWLADYVDSPRRARIVVTCYLAGAAISALLALLTLFGPLPLGSVVLAFGDRAKGLFKDPNVFGPFLVPGVLIVLEEIVHPRLLKIPKPAAYLLVLVLTLGVVFSYSRAAWLNLGVGVAILFAVLALRRGGARQAAKLLTLLLVSGAVLVAVLDMTGSLGFLNERASVQGYDTERFGAQDFGIEYAEHHFLGAGPGQFDVISPLASHSTFVRVLAEQGILGFALLITIFGATLILAARNALEGRSTYGIGSAALLGAWVGVVLNSPFVDTLHWRHLWMIAGLVWAGAMAHRLRRPAAPARSPVALSSGDAPAPRSGGAPAPG